MTEHVPTAVIGAGHAGLAVSRARMIIATALNPLDRYQDIASLRSRVAHALRRFTRRSHQLACESDVKARAEAARQSVKIGDTTNRGRSFEGCARVEGVDVPYR